MSTLFSISSGIDRMMKADRRVICIPEIRSAEIGLAHQQALADEVTSQSCARTLMLWRCKPALLVTRSETRLHNFASAAAEMRARGWPILLRKSGGGACPVGSGTMQVSMIEPAVAGETMTAKYLDLAGLLQPTLRFFHIASRIGSVEGSYCPGSYDLAVDGKKIAGMSQHWFRNRVGIRCVVTTGSLNIEEAPDVFAAVVNQFYRMVESPLRCRASALTNMRLCGGLADRAGSNLASEVMNQLRAAADLLDGRPDAAASAAPACCPSKVD